MIRFRQGLYSSVTELSDNVKKKASAWAEKNPNTVKNLKSPFLVLSASGLALNVANTYNNRKKSKGDREIRERELDALNKLTTQLNRTSNSVRTLNTGIKQVQPIQAQPVQQPAQKGRYSRIKSILG